MEKKEKLAFKVAESFINDILARVNVNEIVTTDQKELARINAKIGDLDNHIDGFRKLLESGNEATIENAQRYMQNASWRIDEAITNANKAADGLGAAGEILRKTMVDSAVASIDPDYSQKIVNTLNWLRLMHVGADDIQENTDGSWSLSDSRKAQMQECAKWHFGKEEVEAFCLMQHLLAISEELMQRRYNTVDFVRLFKCGEINDEELMSMSNYRF